jgi:hypothetical protein
MEFFLPTIKIKAELNGKDKTGRTATRVGRADVWCQMFATANGAAMRRFLMFEVGCLMFDVLTGTLDA